MKLRPSISSIALVVVGSTLTFVAGWQAHKWSEIDRCLDLSGRWDYSQQNCDYGK